jgi:hypothetical protein
MTRRKREINGLANEQDFPHLVELVLPPGGFRSVFLEIDTFHRERRIPVPSAWVLCSAMRFCRRALFAPGRHRGKPKFFFEGFCCCIKSPVWALPAKSRQRELRQEGHPHKWHATQWGSM